jgi:CheY-like chemotaxis protein
LTAVILVCDDDEVHRDLIRATLEPHGHRVHEIDDGDVLVAAVAAFRPELVILDLRMPTGGLDVLRDLRSDPELAHTPVLVLTGAAFRSDRSASYAAGADHVLPKPFSPKELAATVADLVAGPEPMTARATGVGIS